MNNDIDLIKICLILLNFYKANLISFNAEFLTLMTAFLHRKAMHETAKSLIKIFWRIPTSSGRTELLTLSKSWEEQKLDIINCILVSDFFLNFLLLFVCFYDFIFYKSEI